MSKIIKQKEPNLIKVGDHIKLKTIKQKMSFLKKNLDVLNIRYSDIKNYISYTNKFDNSVELFQELFHKLKYRTYLVTDIFVLNDIKMVKIFISENETLMLSLDYVSKKEGSTFVIDMVNKHIKILKQKYKTILVENIDLNKGFSIPLKTNNKLVISPNKNLEYNNIENYDIRFIIFSDDLDLVLSPTNIMNIVINNGEIDTKYLLELNPKLGENIKIKFI